MTIDPSIQLAGRILVTLIFGMALVGKLRHREEFVGVVANYRLLPEALVVPVAWLIIVLEGVVVLSLGSAIQLAAGAAVAALLLGSFALAMAINVRRGRVEIDCGCFQSALRQRLSGALVIRNLVLIAVTVPLLKGEPAQVSSWQMFNGIAAGILLFVLYQVLDQLLALRESAAALRRRFT